MGGCDLQLSSPSAPPPFDPAPLPERLLPEHDVCLPPVHDSVQELLGLNDLEGSGVAESSPSDILVAGFETALAPATFFQNQVVLYPVSAHKELL